MPKDDDQEEEKDSMVDGHSIRSHSSSTPCRGRKRQRGLSPERRRNVQKRRHESSSSSSSSTSRHHRRRRSINESSSKRRSSPGSTSESSSSRHRHHRRHGRKEKKRRTRKNGHLRKDERSKEKKRRHKKAKKMKRSKDDDGEVDIDDTSHSGTKKTTPVDSQNSHNQDAIPLTQPHPPCSMQDPQKEDRRARMVPMSREQYDKQQSVVREVYDEESGRVRLVRGSGEIIERIVSRDDHQRINQRATRGDGTSFSKHIYQALKRR